VYPAKLAVRFVLWVSPLINSKMEG
jgi:hypothetical protein